MPVLETRANDSADLTYETPLTPEHVRVLCDTSAELRAQYRAHLMDAAAYLRTTGAHVDPARGVVGLRASEQRRYDRRLRVAEEVRALAGVATTERASTAAPAIHSVSVAAAMLDLY